MQNASARILKTNGCLDLSQLRPGLRREQQTTSQIDFGLYRRDLRRRTSCHNCYLPRRGHIGQHSFRISGTASLAASQYRETICNY